MIERKAYLKRLIAKKDNGMIKIITGVRRCGKSYLLFKIFRDHLISSGVKDDEIIELALGDYENQRFLDPDVLYAFLKESTADKNKHYYVLLDEVQFVIT